MATVVAMEDTEVTEAGDPADGEEATEVMEDTVDTEVMVAA